MLREPKIKQQEQQDGQKVCGEYFRNKFADSPDVVINGVTLPGGGRLTLAFVDGMVSSQLIDDYILKPLVELGLVQRGRALLDKMTEGAVYHCQRKLCDTVDTCVKELISGSVLLISDEAGAAASFEVKGFEKRGISEPASENVLKGSKEAFIEVLRVNTALVRRRLQTDTLKINQLTLGRRSATTVSVVYLEGVANANTVEEIKSRLSSVDIDAIVSAGQVETFLLDRKSSIFPQLVYTERVDKFCGNIAEGRVGIIIDGLPVAYIAPVDLVSFMQAPEDYAHGHIISSLLRILRFSCLLAALLMPAIYVSITTFHQEMIPTKLAVSIISNKQGVPFPSYIEVLLMLLAFEILLEAGLRLPNAVGSAVSIVGGLVVGQAAISAGILSPGVVIVISATGICGFVMPSQDLSNTVRLCRAALVLAAIAGGLLTVTLGLILLIYRMCSLEVFGVAYLSPFVASDGRGMFNDTIVRSPWYKAKTRPASIKPADVKRQGGPL